MPLGLIRTIAQATRMQAYLCTVDHTSHNASCSRLRNIVLE
jgi:hypothetical protein